MYYTKHFAYLFFFCLISFSAVAQKEWTKTLWNGTYNPDYAKTINDTIDTHFVGATPALYASPNGGFVSGNSGYGEKIKLQEFRVTSATSYIVESVLFWFAYKKQESAPSDSSSVMFVMYDMDSSAMVDGMHRPIPHRLIRRDSVLVSAIDTGMSIAQGMNVWNIDPVHRALNYAVGIDVSPLHLKDTIALVSSSDGDPRISGLSWEFWNGAWHTIKYDWGLDIDFAVFPVVDNTIAGNEPVINDVQLSVYPNPVISELHVATEIVRSGSLQINIYDASGKLVWADQSLQLLPGKTNWEIPCGGWIPGVYFVAVSIDGNPSQAKKIVKVAD